MSQQDSTKQYEADEHRLRLRNLQLADYPDVKDIMERVYAGIGGAWTRKQFSAQINRFPEGQICVEDNGRVIGAVISMIIEYDRFGDRHTYGAITSNGFLTNHDPNGDVLYGVDIFVDPDYRGMRLGRRLYDARKELCRNLNLRAIVAGGRIPGYKSYADEITPEQYMELVKRREVHDPILSFQLANDFHVRRVITGYLPEDDQSKSYATLVQWDNIFYEPDPGSLIGGRKTNIRVGAVQWQMRRVQDFDDLITNIEFFVDAMAGYQCDFILFPEFFNAPLLAQFNQEDPAEAMRGLAQYTDEIVDAMSRLAVSYNINIIAGSMPVYTSNVLYNVAFLCRRDGTTDHQYKLHVTPDERFYWGVQGGESLRCFDTDVGRIGILVCFDVEFPELPRLLADKGMQVLFVPFWTDTKNAYLRVRRCAQARAIENECYVPITGSVGNLPQVENIEIQYSQAAVFSPSDFAFPHDGIVAESTPNTEMTLITDLDMDKIKQLRAEGSVRNTMDRRLDLYRVEWLDQEQSETTE